MIKLNIFFDILFNMNQEEGWLQARCERDRERSEQETPVHHETRLRARQERTRNRRQQESPDSRESRLQFS